MGQDKAVLTYKGKSLLKKQVDLVREAGATNVWISCRREQVATFADLVNSEVSWILDPDPDRNLGPLGGLVAAFKAISEELVFVVAVDLPAINVPLVHEILSRGKLGGGCVPALRGHYEPLCALYSRSEALAVGHSFLEIQSLRLQDWVRHLVRSGSVVPWDCPIEWVSNFVNPNTPEAWLEAATLPTDPMPP